jgi:predicted metallo-beta-lactamase superfamily hydrolase
LNIIPLAFESLGVRSQATLVETKDLRILIDPAVSLAPRRYGLPPHQIEVDRLKDLAKRIYDEAKSSDVIIITHYHYDHHDPGYIIPLDIYAGKTVYIKDPYNFINPSQRFKRAPRFINAIKGIAKVIDVADGKSFKHGYTTIQFSDAVLHGADERLGYVVQVAVKDNDDSTVLFTSDIEGMPKDMHVKFTKSVKPNFLIVDGPLSYLLGKALSDKELEDSIKNLEDIVKDGLEYAIIDHHVLRDVNYEKIIKPVKDNAKSIGCKVTTAAEYLNEPIQILEAKRRELFEKDNKPANIPKGLAKLLSSGEGV